MENEIRSKDICSVECEECGRRGWLNMAYVKDKQTGIITELFMGVKHWVDGKYDCFHMTEYITLERAMELCPQFRNIIGIDKEKVMKEIRNILSNGGNGKTLGILISVSKRLENREDVISIQSDIISKHQKLLS
jgi:hypothetical protein